MLTKYSKNSKIVKYYYNVNELFLIFFKYSGDVIIPVSHYPSEITLIC